MLQSLTQQNPREELEMEDDEEEREEEEMEEEDPGPAESTPNVTAENETSLLDQGSEE